MPAELQISRVLMNRAYIQYEDCSHTQMSLLISVIRSDCIAQSRAILKVSSIQKKVTITWWRSVTYESTFQLQE